MQPEDQYSIDQDLAQWPVLNSQQVKGPNNLTVDDKPASTLLSSNYDHRDTDRDRSSVPDRSCGLGNAIRGSEVTGV